MNNLVVRGSGNRDESLKRLLYIGYYHPELFYRNLWILPVVGRYKDVFDLLVMDAGHKNQLDRSEIFSFLKNKLNCPSNDLLLKYLPRIHKAKTVAASHRVAIAKEFARYLNLTPKEYRQLKSRGKAHDWQKSISVGNFNIDWNNVSGVALSKLVSSKFLVNQGLEKDYLKWLKTQKTIKYNGYPFDLLKTWNRNKTPINKWTVDKQFNNLIDNAKIDGGDYDGMWCAIDTSGSMGRMVTGSTNTTAYDVCISLGAFFSSLNKGAFHKHVIGFDSKSRIIELNGGFTSMIDQIKNEKTCWGSTNFQSIIDEIVRVRNSHPNIPLKDYPKSLLVVSDMQFNPVTRCYGGNGRFDQLESYKNEKTNYEAAMTKLRTSFPKKWVSDFKIIWWDCVGRKKDFPSTLDDQNAFYLSGFDGSVLNLLLGKEENNKKKNIRDAKELLEEALNQEIFQLVN